ncbi:endopeptidase La [Desulforhopalus singaporensis]|uniref:endopeptidase La n=1 Tax=Desulforhopalus singaporensis TaxID=91360 RepID=A0A1H0L7W5_9BACT|nr:endopeptidase La [Desulforhopalus singaporensis]SDO64308.1 ATP-dependent Lon protease [Desulforhopalus singaporensis]
MFFKRNSKPIEEEIEQKSEESPLEKMRQQVKSAKLPGHAYDAAVKELDKLEKSDPSVAEYAIGLNYVELLVSLPWNISTKSHLELGRAKSILDSRHSGLDQVKQRILEFLAAKTLRQSVKANILIVDDEEIARNNMNHVLCKDGFSCECAENGIAALKILGASDIDLIISDLKMEGMDGYELLAEVNRSYPEIPVIMVTGFASVNSAVQAMKSGAAHYLSKPVNLNELRRTVAEVLDQKNLAEMGRGPILCFTGPPGTGKTSVGQAIAEALQFSFIRMSLAGLRDEAELRGHRRTYVGAMPGRIIMELKRAGVNNPVMMLDEIDKIGQDFRGDPASVMLEVLDPEQNVKFTDYYLDIPFNLSNIMFIATANDISRLPGPLRDRMEVIEFSGYTAREKCRIAEKFIIPRQLKGVGLQREGISFEPGAVGRIITEYTRESGLRNLEREIATVCRKMALLHLSDVSRKAAPKTIEADDIPGFLGPRRYVSSVGSRKPAIGITTGLVWTETGGEIINVEAVAMKGTGHLMLTGSLGDILRESAQAALSFIRSRADEYRIDDHLFSEQDIHVHFPAGAISKDGPSAGVTIFVALLSLLTGRPFRSDVAMTGEMTLSGQILAVSGIKEKLLAAQRAGIKVVVIPQQNKEELEVLPADVTAGLEVILIDNGNDAVPHVFTS